MGDVGVMCRTISRLNGCQLNQQAAGCSPSLMDKYEGDIKVPFTDSPAENKNMHTSASFQIKCYFQFYFIPSTWCTVSARASLLSRLHFVGLQLILARKNVQADLMRPMAIAITPGAKEVLG